MNVSLPSDPSGAAAAAQAFAIQRANHTGTQGMTSVPVVKAVIDRITPNSNPAAYHDATEFATAAQGLKADSALQSFVESDPVASAALTAYQAAVTAIMALKAPLASPALTGVPSAPTASPGDNSTKLSTTAFVTAAINALIGSAPTLLSTLAAIDAQLATDETAASALASSVGSVSTALAALAAVARSGSYSDLTNKPTIPAKQIAIATVDFGYASGNGEGDIATSTVAAAWVTLSSRIICVAAPSDSLDHTVDETLSEDVRFTAVNLIPGVSFDVEAVAPNQTWGRHNCSILAF